MPVLQSLTSLPIIPLAPIWGRSLAWEALGLGVCRNLCGLSVHGAGVHHGSQTLPAVAAAPTAPTLPRGRWPRALGPACCALQVAAVTDISFKNRYCYNRRINQKLG